MGINVFTASGRLGSDMEVRVTQAGKFIGSFSLPIENGWGDKKKTAWVTCKVLGERAEKLQHYLKKGSKVTVTGAFTLDEWEKDGVKHSRPVIIVGDIELPERQQEGQQQQRPQQQGGCGQQAQQPSQYSEPPMDFEDIPF